MESQTPPCSIRAALEWFRKAFRADAAADIHVAYQFELKGEAGGSFWVRVDAGRLDFGEGRLVDSDVVFRISASDFFGVLAGRENPDLLFMEDRLAVEGDLSRALTLRRIFPARI